MLNCYTPRFTGTGFWAHAGQGLGARNPECESSPQLSQLSEEALERQGVQGLLCVVEHARTLDTE